MAMKAKPRRAPGLDEIQIDYVKHLASTQSVWFAVLFMKSWILASEPLQYKGGLVKAISKKPGRLTVANTRGIALLGAIGKLYHGVVRARLLPHVTAHRTMGQFGRFKGQQTGFASVMLKAFARAAGAKGLSLHVMFLDVRHAFHSMLRSHVFGDDVAELPPVLQTILQAEGLTVSQLAQDMSEHSSAFCAHASPLTQQVLRDMHKDTWFTVADAPAHHDRTCHRTWRGSRPGSPLADLVYNQMMSSLLRIVAQIVNEDHGIQKACSQLEVL